MSVDPAPQQAPSSSSAPRIKVLLKPGDLDLKSRREKDIYQQLKGRYFIHTPTLDPLFLLETGMGTEFDLIFRMLEWTNFWDITELGSRLLTIEFLCTLQICEGGIVFRMFKQDIMLSWRELSDHLGFSPRCLLDIDTGLPNFDRNQFWREISRDLSFNQPRTSDMEHPTLRMFHKWLGYNLFFRDDIRKVRIGDLQLLYAAINKTAVSPVMLLVSHWLAIPTLQGPVGCTSLVTRLATNLNLLENSSLEFIDESRTYHGYDTFRQARMLKREIGIMYMLYDNDVKVRLPNPSLGLYAVQNYLIDVAAEPVNQRVPQRVASERITTHQRHDWSGADPGPEEAAHLHYRDYNPRVLRDPWVQSTQPPEPTPEEWPEGQDHQWANPPYTAGRFSADPYGASTSRTQPHFDAGRYSDASYVFTGDYYYDTRAFHNRTDNALLNIQNQQAEQMRRWEAQEKWNQEQAAQIQGLREDTATIENNIASMMSFFNIE